MKAQKNHKFSIGIDIGTSGCKAALYRDDGCRIGQATRPIRTLKLPDGGVEQDAEQLWQVICDAIRQLTREAVGQGVTPDDIVTIGCCSQYSSTIPVDANGIPTGNMVLWMDKRGMPYNLAIWESDPKAVERWIEIHGIMPLPDGNDCLGHILFLKHQRPEIYAAATAFLEAMDYLTARLTGRVTSTICSAFMLLLTDNRIDGERGYHPELVRLSGVDAEKLAELVPIDQPVGTVRADIAQDLGLSPHTRVYPGTNDSQSASLGCGVLTGTQAGLSIGTTSVLIAQVDKKQTDIDHAIVSMPSPTVGRYIVMAENGLGGGTLDYFLHSQVFASDALADHAPRSGRDPFEGVDAAVNSIPPGSDGVLFLPWLSGTMAPHDNSHMRGAFLNLSLTSSRAHLTRAVLEGVAFNLRCLQSPVETFIGRRLSHFVFGGGAARSPAWSQILADILDRPVHTLQDPHNLNARASALSTLHYAGYTDPSQLSNPPIAKVHEPNPSLRQQYDFLFEQFVAGFEATLPICTALNP